ncbi:MAG: hypothetical protein J2P37_33560 [Ktedonobacteraceae bacterium]|nr:hypothetical protein [Ktedonobacteraceae bacterium]
MNRVARSCRHLVVAALAIVLLGSVVFSYAPQVQLKTTTEEYANVAIGPFVRIIRNFRAGSNPHS